MSRKGRPLPAVPKGHQDDDGYEVPVGQRTDYTYDSLNFGGNDKKIRVGRLPRSVSKDTLELYFESKKHFGREMTVEDVELDIDNGTAVVIFEKSSDAEYVLEKHRKTPCKLSKKEIDIEAFTEVGQDTDTIDASERKHGFQDYSDIYESSETDTIEVRGFSESCSEDTLQYYFENTKRSGGGEITTFAMKRDKGYAHITFKDKSVVQRVVVREHTVEGQTLSVHPFIISKTELLLVEVPDTVSEENLANFVEAKLKVAAISVTFNEDRSKALVQFANEIKFSKVQEVCEKFKLGGVNVVPVQIPVTNGIIVTDIPEDVTHDSVEVYFENTRRSNGGETVKVEVFAEYGYCLIFFKDAKVVARVCQKKDHKIHGQHVDVQPYNEYLGLPGALEGLAFKLPEPISLEDQESHKIKFLKANTSQRSTLESELAKCKAKIFWDDDPITIECTLTTDDKAGRKLLKTWTDEALECLKQFTDVLVVKKKSVDTRLWTDIRDEVGRLSLTHPDGVALFMEKQTGQIILVAHKGLIESVWKDIISSVDTAERKDREKKESATEDKALAEWKIAYLRAAHFEEDMLEEHTNVKIRFEERKGKGKIYLTGPKQTIHTVWIAMFERINNVKHRELELENEQIELLKNDKTVEKVKQSMKKKRVPDVWEVKPNCVILYADEEDDLAKMETAINKALAKLSISLDSGTEGILKSDKWKTTENSLKKQFSGCVVISVNKTQLEIFTLADIQDRVSDELNSFLAQNAIYKEQMALTPQVVSYFQNVIKHKYDQEVQELTRKGLNVKISLNVKSGAISVEGTSDGVREAKGLIKSLQNCIEIKQHTIKHPKVRKYLACVQGHDCVKKVQSNTPCIIDMEGSGFKRSVNTRQSSVNATFDKDKPATCADVTLKSGVKVIVVGGDITELQVDVLVNAANREMKHAGGLARVIVTKGGQDIQSECDARIGAKGALSEGDVFMGKGGNLKCKFVAHAVGPHWRGGGNGEELCLQKAVYTCIEKTEKKHLKSIAMPALSAGMFQYPVNLSCMEIVKAIDQHFQGTKSSIKEVYLCDISKATVDAFTKALQAVMSNVKVQVDLGQTDGTKPAWLIHSEDDSVRKKSSGRVEIEVVKGVLVQEQVDVIVNSASPDLQLQRGTLSNAILQAGGRKIQQDCANNYPNGINVGEVAVTTSGKLKCAHIYHISIKHFDRGNARVCFQGLSECVSACLQEADKNGHTSISFPAMGTGAQRYPKDKVAKEMFKAVTTFSNNNPSTCIKKVRFIIFTEDDETFEVFITEEKNWKGGNSHHRPSIEKRRNLKPGLGQLVNESRGMAEFKIGGLKIEVHQGDITEDKSEAIVASCNLDLDLKKGAVTKALLRKGGDAIEQDCKKQKSTMQKEGIAITTAGNLPAKYIIHVDTKYKTWEWTPVILSCLKKAEKHKFSSIAFPALGTSVGCKPEDIADVMCSAIGDFLKDGPKQLQEIRLVVFQKDMVSDFITGMKASVIGHPRSGDRPQSQRRQSRHQDKHSTSEQKNDDSEDSCTITIYAEDTDKANKAVKSFEKTTQNDWIQKKLEDPGITRLTSDNIKDLKAMAKNNHVDVTIDRSSGIIEVVGLVANVLEVFDAIYTRLRSADKSFYMKDQARLMSNIVKWLYLKDQKEIPFLDRVNLEIETAYKQKEKHVKIKDRSGGEYEIDFGSMTEHDVKQPNTKCPVIRRDLVAGASFNIPKNWQRMNEKENTKLVTLNAQDPEYQKVLNELKKTLGRNPNIVKIERIQNKTLYTQYAAKRKELNVNNPNKKDNERMLWHGTADYAVQSINSHGFNRSYCGKNATAIGQGVYFAVNANYSDQPTYSPVGSDGNKRMYRCLVLTGKYCNGTSDMRVQPPIDKSRPHILYDSVTNNCSSPIMFVVFNDTQAYPEHIITYK